MMATRPLPRMFAATVLVVLGSWSAAAQDVPGSAGTRPYSMRWVYESATAMFAPSRAAPARPVTVQAPAASLPTPAPAPAASDGGGDLLDTAAKGVSDTVDALVNVFDVTNFNSPAKQLGRMKAAKGYEFWALVSDAGFELKEADTDVGLIPEFTFKFDKARDLSGADRAWLERKLRRHARFHKGLAAKMKRAIVHALLEAHDLNEGFSLEGFSVGFAPLPSMKFAVAPKDSRLLDKEHDWLYRAILANRETTRRVGAGKPAAKSESGEATR